MGSNFSEYFDKFTFSSVAGLKHLSKKNLVVSTLAGVMQVAGLHGGGSPQMETITMMARYDLESLKSIAKYLFGIEKELPRYERPTVTPRKMLERFRKA